MDPLRMSVELPFRARFYPRGFPLDLSTNSPLVMQAAAESWGCFPRGSYEPTIQLRVAVDETDTSPLPPEPVFRAQRHLLAVVAGPGTFAFCDLEHAFGFCWLTATVAANQDYLRYHFLDAMAYTILEHLRCTSIHAACVALNGRGVLLCGPPAAGKSCLAFACARQGWTLIDDESSILVRGRPDNTVLGDPFHMRFRESAVELFPELGDLPVSTTRDGETSIEVLTREMPEIATACSTPVERVVFLERHKSSAAQLAPVRKSEALSRLESQLPLFDEHVREAQMASLVNLLREEPCVLRYSDLDSAVQKLEELV